MCGIAGIFKLDGSPATENEIETMLKTLPHRGPDASGRYCDGPVGLGHTRLAILDLVEASNQPFMSVDGRYSLTYNGEVFNYIELRRELESLGTTFRTHSDTEVVLAAYIQWGPDCVKRFNGMWAFAIHDRDSGTLFCSRDRFGVKPFVFAVHKNTFVFASEAKAILALYPELRVPDYTNISHCLRQNLTSGLESTSFQNIKRLLPSHSLMVTSKGIQKSRFWDYPKKVDRSITKEAAIRGIRELLNDAVRIRMRSDVPIGLTLSSGVDSTAIAHLMRSHNPEDALRSYTSFYATDMSSETDVAEATSRDLNFEFSSVPCSSDQFIERLRKIIRHVESPHSAPAIMPLWEIMKTASVGTRVMLEGQGADELFGGYLTIYFGHAAKELLRKGRIISLTKLLWSSYRTIKSHPQWGRSYFFSSLLRALFQGSHKWIRRFGRGDESVYIGPLKDIADYRFEFDTEIDDCLNRKLQKSHHVELVELLHYGDAISMAHSIESRMPFMDYRLVEFAFQLPAEFKVNAQGGKQILREALRGVIPDSILDNQKKLGFTTPISNWIRQRPEQVVYPILFTERCAARGIFDIEKMKAIVSKHVAGERDYGPLIFRWLTCELWFQEFIDPATDPS